MSNKICFFLMAIAFIMSACNSDTPDVGNTKELPSSNGEADETGEIGSGTCADIAIFEASCPIGCPLGYARDANNCRLCECNESGPFLNDCQPLTCPERCEDYMLDPNGCFTCNCGRADGDGEGAPENPCADIAIFEASCPIGCPLGYARDANNCRLCECNESGPFLNDCQPLTCPERCEDYMLDPNGCFTCNCGR